MEFGLEGSLFSAYNDKENLLYHYRLIYMYQEGSRMYIRCQWKEDDRKKQTTEKSRGTVGMSIQMIGTDHSLAGVEIREKFSFTGKQAKVLMEEWKARKRVHGIVLLSTCNSMEIYISVEEKADYCGLLCEMKGLYRKKYAPFICTRSGRDAVQHLFEMTAGLHSLIVGEDQILTQVREALSFARENYAADRVLEVLFRQAVTTAKEIKTKVSFPRQNLSAAGEAVRYLKSRGESFAGKKCLVIGNGVMGRLTAQALLEEGRKLL